MITDFTDFHGFQKKMGTRIVRIFRNQKWISVSSLCGLCAFALNLWSSEYSEEFVGCQRGSFGYAQIFINVLRIAHTDER